MKTLKVSRIFLGDFLILKKKSCSTLSLTSQSQVPLCYWQLGARGCIFIFTSSSFYRNCQSIKGNINNYENNGYLSLNFLLRGVLRWKNISLFLRKPVASGRMRLSVPWAWPLYIGYIHVRIPSQGR